MYLFEEEIVANNISPQLFCQIFVRFEHHDGGSYHIETSRLICKANRWAGFCMKGTSFMKDLKENLESGWKLAMDPFNLEVK